MLKWTRFSPLPTEVELENHEQAMGITLPPRYRQYVLSENGGQPCTDMSFDIPDANGQVMLGVLYGIFNQESSLNLATVYEELKDNIPDGYLPIGEDPGGNRLLLGTKGLSKDKVFFWDRVGFLVKPSGGNLFQVADDIAQLLNSLQEVQG